MGVLVFTAGIALPGCLLVGSKPAYKPRPYTPAPASVSTSKPKPKPAPPIEKSEAWGTFDQLREKLLKDHPDLSKVSGAFAIGVDVSGSAHAKGILEYTIKLLSDMCGFFFAPGDRIALVPWDSRIREQHVHEFDFTDPDGARKSLVEAFEGLENLVDPESRGSNVLDARGFCIEQALKLAGDSDARLCPVVLIFSDTYLPDMLFKNPRYSTEKLAQLRAKMRGGTGEFGRSDFETARGEIILHELVGSCEGLTRTSSINRLRSQAPTAPAWQRPAQRPAPPPPPPPDHSGWRVLLIVFALLGLIGLIVLPFAWQHHITIAGTKETLRAFGGRVLIQAGSGISPRNVVFISVPGLSEQVLLAIEAKGPQLVARARRGVRLNDGRTELVVPMGRAVQLRVAIDGVPGEQTIDVNAQDFFSANAGPIIGMGIAFLVLIGCIIG